MEFSITKLKSLFLEVTSVWLVDLAVQTVVAVMDLDGSVRRTESVQGRHGASIAVGMVAADVVGWGHRASVVGGRHSAAEVGWRDSTTVGDNGRGGSGVNWSSGGVDDWLLDVVLLNVDWVRDVLFDGDWVWNVFFNWVRDWSVNSNWVWYFLFNWVWLGNWVWPVNGVWSVNRVRYLLFYNLFNWVWLRHWSVNMD